MLADQLGHRLSVGRERLYRRDVVVAHQAAVAFHIGAQNRGQPALDVRDVPRGRAIVRTAHRSVFSSSELILFHYQFALPWIRSATGSSRLTDFAPAIPRATWTARSLSAGDRTKPLTWTTPQISAPFPDPRIRQGTSRHTLKDDR